MKITKNSLLKFSFAVSLLGILLLLLLSNLIQPGLINIKEINNKNLNQKIKINGQITSIKSYESSDFQILTIQDSTGKIQAVLNSDKELNIYQNKTMTITGRITRYKDNLQIQVDKIIAQN